VNLYGTMGEIALVFVHTSGVWNTQLTAVDNTEASIQNCHGKYFVVRQ